MKKLLLLLLPVVLLGACTQKIDIKIIGTTDVHGKIFPYNFVSGDSASYSLSQIYSYVQQERDNKNQEVVLLDNGDILQGEPTMYFSNFIDTQEVHLQAKVMNFMGYDCATVGNHDIETGNKVFDKFNKELNMPWLAANVKDTRTGKCYFKPYHIINRKGIKIAVLGITTPGVEHWVPEYNRKNMAFDDMIESAEYWMKEIQAKEKPDMVIGLFHAGYDYTYGGGDSTSFKNENASLLVAHAVKGFDAILIGHDHKKHNKYITNQFGEKVLILDQASHGRVCGAVNVSFSKSLFSAKIDTLYADLVDSKEYVPDADFLKAFNKEYTAVKEWLNHPLGELSSDIYSKDAVFGPSAFLQIIHEAQLMGTNADISIAANLAYNAKLQKGAITLKELFRLYRYDNDLFTLKLTGKEIDGFLEYAYDIRYNTMQSANDHLMNMKPGYKKGDLQLAAKYYSFSEAYGVDYTVDVSAPQYNKVTIGKFSNGEAFYMDSSYTVAMNSYRASGGGGHLTHGANIDKKELKDRVVSIAEDDIRMIIAEYIEFKKQLSPNKATNWKVLPESWFVKGKSKDYRILYANKTNRNY
jgi:2',3'-cyclic-nucleotide 2'-phosphodiesterase/3'-nucleotidase